MPTQPPTDLDEDGLTPQQEAELEELYSFATWLSNVESHLIALRNSARKLQLFETEETLQRMLDELDIIANGSPETSELIGSIYMIEAGYEN